jgi:hypothetical protein
MRFLLFHGDARYLTPLAYNHDAARPAMRGPCGKDELYAKKLYLE